MGVKFSIRSHIMMRMMMMMMIKFSIRVHSHLLVAVSVGLIVALVVVTSSDGEAGGRPGARGPGHTCMEEGCIGQYIFIIYSI